MKLLGQKQALGAVGSQKRCCAQRGNVGCVVCSFFACACVVCVGVSLATDARRFPCVGNIESGLTYSLILLMMFSYFVFILDGLPCVFCKGKFCVLRI